jgi:hypothetical protein
MGSSPWTCGVNSARSHWRSTEMTLRKERLMVAAASGETTIARALKSEGRRGSGALEVWWRLRRGGEGVTASL